MCGTQASDRALGLNGDARGWNRPVTAPGPPFNCIQSDCTPAAAPNNSSHSAWALLRSGRPPRRPGNAGSLSRSTGVLGKHITVYDGKKLTRGLESSGRIPSHDAVRRSTGVSPGTIPAQRVHRQKYANHMKAINRAGEPGNLNLYVNDVMSTVAPYRMEE